MFLTIIRLNKYVIKTVLEIGKTLKFVSDCYKIQQLWYNHVYNYPHALEFFPECYKTREMFYKEFHRCFLYLVLFLININFINMSHSCLFISFFNCILP